MIEKQKPETQMAVKANEQPIGGYIEVDGKKYSYRVIDFDIIDWYFRVSEGMIKRQVQFLKTEDGEMYEIDSLPKDRLTNLTGKENLIQVEVALSTMDVTKELVRRLILSPAIDITSIRAHKIGLRLMKDVMAPAVQEYFLA